MGIQSQTEDTEKLQRDLSDRVDRFKDSLNNQWDGEEVPRDSDYDLNDLDIEYEYDRFTRRAALATLGLWGFLTARSTQELINDKTAAKDAREYLAAISIDIKQARASGIPTLMQFRQPGQKAEIDYRIATPLRHAGGPTKVNFVDVVLGDDDLRSYILAEKYGIFSTPTLLWLDENSRVSGAGTGNLPQGLIEVNTLSLVSGEPLPYSNAVLPGADIIERSPGFLSKLRSSSNVQQERSDAAPSADPKQLLEDAIAGLPSATPMNYDD